MLGKKIWLSLGIIAVMIGAGYFVFSVISSPEAKLANAVGNLLDEEKVQIESEYQINIQLDPSTEGVYLTEEEELAINIVKDLFQSIKGNSSIIVDFDEQVIELDGSYGIDGDILGEEISLQLPFRFYLDEKTDEVAIDLDPYVEFIPDVLDVLAYNILPNIPDVKAAEEELAYLLDGEDLGDWLSKEVSGVMKPILKDTLQDAKYTDTLESEGSIFNEKREEYEVYLAEFMLEKMLDYFKEQSDADVISEEDDWIYLNLDWKLVLKSLIHALNEVDANEDAKQAFEEGENYTVKAAIEDIEEALEELGEATFNVNAGFKIVKGKITESDVEMTVSVEEDGTTVDMNIKISSAYTYDDEVEYSFYGKDRKVLTEEDLEYMFYDLEWEMEYRFSELFAELEAAFYEDYELSEEELELFELVEAKQVSHEDFGWTAEEMYYWVVDLELAGWVKPGTSDLYLD